MSFNGKIEGWAPRIDTPIERKTKERRTSTSPILTRPVENAPLFLNAGDYSCRSALIGSTRDAARAGAYDPVSATISKAPAATARLIGSSGRTLYRALDSNWVSHNAATKPTRMPPRADRKSVV